jgi:ATP-dependent DNA helicase RecG
VCPVIEESKEGDLQTALDAHASLTRELRGLRVGLLHGRLPGAEKTAVMDSFAKGATQVLVCTTVIEVGVDVPNASLMVIESAERFGLSQLHQLRGRIGRGAHESVCLLFGPKESRRLRALAEHRDGFRLAEIDLELRGEGEMIGVRQSGMQLYRFARLPDDAELLERARHHARAILDSDPRLERPEHVLLEDAIVRAYGADALEPIPA